MIVDKEIINTTGYIVRPKVQRTESEIMEFWNSKDEIMVSIHCLAFNQVKFIEDAINGFLIQKTNFSFEILIHDDASTDGTDRIIKAYTDKYPKIIKPWYQKKNTFSNGFGTGFFNLLRVKGKYTALCEGDDFWFDENKLQLQVDFLEKNPSIVICGHDVIKVDSKCKVINKSELRLNENKKYSQNDIAFGVNIPSKSAVWRSNLPSLGPKAPWGDTFLFSYYGNFGSAYNFKDAMGVYRIHSEGVWSGLDRRKQLEDSYNIHSQIPLYTLPKFKAIAYFRFLFFLLNYKDELSITNSETKRVAKLILENIGLNSFIYIFSFVVEKSTKKLMRVLGVKV